MRIPLNEIWNFTNILDQDEKRPLSFALLAGPAHIDQIAIETIEQLPLSDEYDTELLPSIFTFREILWQPDVYKDKSMCMPGLSILSAYCNDESIKYRAIETQSALIYALLLEQMALACDTAIDKLGSKKNAVAHVLGVLRTTVFPIIKFFIGHPKNRTDYHQDAINRLNYAVKIMITQLHGKYTELHDPVWEVSLVHNMKSNASKSSAEVKTNHLEQKD